MSAPTILPVPVVSTDLIGSLDTVIPGLGSANEPRTSRGHAAIEARRVAQLWLTGVPLALVDILALSACFIFAVICVTLTTGWAPSVGNHLHLTALVFCYSLIGLLFQVFPGSAMSPVFELRQQVVTVILSFLLLIVLNGTFGKIIAVEVATVGVGSIFAILAMPLARYVARLVCCRFPWWGERVVVVGGGSQGRAIYRFLKASQQRGLRPVGIVDDSHRLWDEAASPGCSPYLGPIDDIERICHQQSAFWTIAVIADRSHADATRILNHCSVIPNLIVIPTRIMLPSLWAECRECGGQVGLFVRDRLLFIWPKLLKRTFDLVVVSILLILSAPFFLIAALLIKVNSPGPVFYGHPRVGEHGRRFKMWKLRSMVPGADQVLDHYLEKHPELREEWDRTQKLKNDPRVIPVIGSLIRTTSLDELPQLWNVFLGHMSLVGPRPVPVTEVKEYSDAFQLYLKVKPGVTGLWQISGRNHVSYQDRMRLNTYYVRNWSVWLDYYILLRTVRTILLREGAF